MATVVMRWLEQSPADYDRGIEMLTLGRLQALKEKIAKEYIWSTGQDEVRVLELGCGTGVLAALMAREGATVSAVDASQSMLDYAEARASEQGLEDDISFFLADITEIGDLFETGSFDFIVSTLVFSELRPEVQSYVLKSIRELLTENGRLILVDEIVPEGFLNKLGFWLLRLPLTLITWLLTRTSTSALRNFNKELARSGFDPSVLESHLFGSLCLLGASLSMEAPQPTAVQAEHIPQLRHKTTVKTLLLDFISLVYRIFPPYPKQRTGLYRIGNPDQESPVLVTGSYELTVRRLVKALDGKVDCWLLVADSGGINVWCAAGGGHFTAEDVISAVNTSDLPLFVSHHALILPQLCANGVDGWRIRDATGWGVHWGPVRAEDIPAYLFTHRKKTQSMRQVTFSLFSRLEMTTVMLALYGLLLLIPFLIFWPSKVLLLLGITALMSYFYGVFLPWIPGKDGLEKGAVMSVLTLILFWTYSLGWGSFTLDSMFGWSLGLGFLAFFIGAEFQGMSPQMRGEQANWLIEGAAGFTVLGIYLIGSLVIGALQ